MKVISTFFCMFAAFLMMAMPVMACCAENPTDINVQVSQPQQASALSCHDVSSDEQNPVDEQTPNNSCPSCDDCSISSAHTDHNGPNALQTGTDIVFVAILNTRQTLPRPETTLLRSTGPPIPRNLLAVDSPAFPLDRLLI